MGCFSGRLMSAASNQKLFCELCSPFCCSFNEFVEEKVITRPIPPPSWLRPPVYIFKVKYWDLPGGTVDKNPPADSGDTDSIPGPTRFHKPWGNWACTPQLLFTFLYNRYLYIFYNLYDGILKCCFLFCNYFMWCYICNIDVIWVVHHPPFSWFNPH